MPLASTSWGDMLRVVALLVAMLGTVVGEVVVLRAVLPPVDPASTSLVTDRRKRMGADRTETCMLCSILVPEFGAIDMIPKQLVNMAIAIIVIGTRNKRSRALLMVDG